MHLPHNTMPARSLPMAILFCTFLVLGYSVETNAQAQARTRTSAAGAQPAADVSRTTTSAQTVDKTTQLKTDDEILETFSGSKVLYSLMPKTVKLTGETTSALTLRVEPSFDEEFQYVFVKRQSGEIEVIRKRSASGNIRYKVSDIEEQSSGLTVHELAKLIHVLETRMTISPAKFEEVTKNLDIAVREHERREALRREEEERRRKAGESLPSSMRDGTRYVIWMGGEKTCDVSVHGVSYKSPAKRDESPLIAWVRNLLKDLE